MSTGSCTNHNRAGQRSAAKPITATAPKQAPQRANSTANPPPNHWRGAAPALTCMVQGKARPLSSMRYLPSGWVVAVRSPVAHLRTTLPSEMGLPMAAVPCTVEGLSLVLLPLPPPPLHAAKKTQRNAADRINFLPTICSPDLKKMPVMPQELALSYPPFLACSAEAGACRDGRFPWAAWAGKSFASMLASATDTSRFGRSPHPYFCYGAAGILWFFEAAYQKN
jgi:hypothetical protein